MINIGCSPAGVLASGGGATMVIAEGDRSLGTVVDDATIKLNLSGKFIQSENKLFLNINSNVTEGRVLLTGVVDTQEIRIEAVRKVWEIEGVREVINEIDATEKGGIKQYLIDVKIKTRIRYKVIADKEISSINYNFEVVNGIVYIIGIAENKKELKKIVKHANTIGSVLKVVSHVIMKDDSRRKKYQRKLQEKKG